LARIFVTGATGFVGRALCEALPTTWSVSALVRSAQARAKLPPQFKPVLGDLRNIDEFSHELADVDCVVHLAAPVDPREQLDDETVDAQAHRATLTLARRAHERGTRRFVFVSSIAAVGFFDGVVTSDSSPHPVSAYGRAKLAAERGLLADRRDTFSPIILRPPTIHGPHERYNFLALAQAISRGLFRCIGTGENVFPLVFIDNVVRALLAAIEGRLTGGIYPLADAEPYSMNRIHTAIASALGIERPRLHLPKSAALALASVNALLSRTVGAPRLLDAARIRTLTANQPFDVHRLLDEGVGLTSSLERDVAETIAGQRKAGLLR
jgi:nucleoside-diphosphate-sugar epimerase